MRQCSAFPVLFGKDEVGTHGIVRADPPPFYLLPTSFGSRPTLRFLSEKASRDQKENSVLQDLVESREQPQTQLTVGAKGLYFFLQFKVDISDQWASNIT